MSDVKDIEITSLQNGINSFVSRCNPDADDTAFQEILKEEQVQLRKKNEEQKLKHYRESSGAPSRYLDESLDTYKPTAENAGAFNWIKGFMNAVHAKKNSKNIVFVSGKRGTGKTHIGCGIARELEGVFITSFDLCLSYDSCRDFNAPETRTGFLKRLCKHEVLVIDEVGKGLPEIEKVLLPYLVNEFYGSGKLLFCLGNINKEDFDKLISEDGVDRMKEVGAYLTLTGDSWRAS